MECSKAEVQLFNNELIQTAILRTTEQAYKHV